jgi:hypothetical protein
LAEDEKLNEILAELKKISKPKSIAQHLDAKSKD